MRIVGTSVKKSFLGGSISTTVRISPNNNVRTHEYGGAVLAPPPPYSDYVAVARGQSITREEAKRLFLPEIIDRCGDGTPHDLLKIMGPDWIDKWPLTIELDYSATKLTKYAHGLWLRRELVEIEI